MSNSKRNSKKTMRELKPWTLPKTISTDSCVQAGSLQQGPNGPSVHREEGEARANYDWWTQVNAQIHPQRARSQRRNYYSYPCMPDGYVYPPFFIPFSNPIPLYLPAMNHFDRYPNFFQPPQYPMFSFPPYSVRTDIPSTSLMQNKTTQIPKHPQNGEVKTDSLESNRCSQYGPKSETLMSNSKMQKTKTDDSQDQIKDQRIKYENENYTEPEDELDDLFDLDL